MNKKILPAALLVIAALSLSVLAQTSVKVTGKKVTYTRRNAEPHKRKFTVNSPKISGTSAALAKKIEQTINLDRVLDLRLKDEISGASDWLWEADYEVLYNKNGLLTVRLWASGAAAYPSTTSQTVVVDLKTGARTTPAQFFVDLPKLAKRVEAVQQQEVKNAIEEMKKDPELKDLDPGNLFDETRFTVEDLGHFEVTEDGVTFLYDYGFPHVIQAAAPDGRYLMRWNDLRPFVRTPGLLAKFVR